MLPKTLDAEVARLLLENIGVQLTTLTANQASYLGVSVDGPYKLLPLAIDWTSLPHETKRAPQGARFASCVNVRVLPLPAAGRPPFSASPTPCTGVQRFAKHGMDPLDHALGALTRVPTNTR